MFHNIASYNGAHVTYQDRVQPSDSGTGQTFRTQEGEEVKLFHTLRSHRGRTAKRDRCYRRYQRPVSIDTIELHMRHEWK